jgi:hypothetical protein
MELRRRRLREARQLPVAFPAWRVWEDRRVRADNGVLALFAAARIASVGVTERAGGAEQSLVSELYTDSELPFRSGFRVTTKEAKLRWEAGVQGLSQMAIVLGVAAMDDLLGGTIRLLRVAGHDDSSAGSLDTGVSAKLKHLSSCGGLKVDSDTLALHGLLVAIRHAVTHYGARQKPVADAWKRLSGDARERWTMTAGRPLPLTGDENELRIDDREALASLKALDCVAVEVADSLRATLDEREWAALVVAEYREWDRAKANDPNSNVRRIKRHAYTVWRIALSEEVTVAALAQPTDAETRSVLQM